MKNNIFISHASQDKEIVELLAGLIRRATLNQVNIWFSNDTKTDGGFFAGDNWFDAILTNLKSSKVVISFITENSNNRPWILYESGYAEALEDTILLPLKFSMNRKDVSVPLQHKQIFGFSNSEEINVFMRKVLKVFDLTYDEEAFEKAAFHCLKEMREKYTPPRPDTEEESSVEKLNQKLDYYFTTFLSYTISNDKPNPMNYEIAVEYQIEGKRNTEFIRIDSGETFSDILDLIYFLLCDQVGTYTYLKSWVLKEKKTDRYAVVSGVQEWIPANCIFKPDSRWEVVYIDDPHEVSKIIKEVRH